MNRLKFAAIGAVALLAWGAWAFLRASNGELDGLVAPGQSSQTTASQPPARIEAAITGDPPPESRVIAGSRVEGRDVEVRVIDPEGATVSAARLVVFRRDQVLDAQTTDAEGTAWLSSGEESAEYVLLAPGWMVSRGELDLAPGRRVLQLADDRELRGTVTIDGSPPREPLTLIFSTQAASEQTENLPRSVRDALRPPGGTHPALHALSTARGEFRFRGLSAPITGQIQWLGPYFLDGPGLEAARTGVWIEDATEAVALRLITGVELRLRVVDGYGRPVPFAQVHTSPNRSSGGWAARGTADASGRFRERLLPTVWDSLRVSVSDANGRARNDHELPASPVNSGPWKVGDLAILDVRTVILLIQDEAGAPIAGAVVGLAPFWNPQEERSGADGRLVVEGAVDEPIDVKVGAYGFGNRQVNVPIDITELVVTLERVAGVEVELLGFEGPRDEILLSVSGTSPLFVESNARTTQPATIQRGIPSFQRVNRSGQCEYEGAVDADGRWKLAGILPGQRFHVALVITGGGVLAETDVSALAPGEVRTVSLSTEHQIHPFTVRVIDTAGLPIRNAFASVADPRDKVSSLRSVGPDGVLTTRNMVGDRVSLSVMAHGYISRELHDVAIPPGVMDVVLDPCAVIEVQLIHVDERPYLGEATINLRDAGPHPGKITLVSPGTFQVEVPDAQEVTIEATGDFGMVRVLHDTRSPTARVVVGGKNRNLRVRAMVPGEPTPGTWAVAASLAGSTKDIARAALKIKPDGSAWTVLALPCGDYELWLERRGKEATATWERTSSAVAVTLVEGEALQEAELKP